MADRGLSSRAEVRVPQTEFGAPRGTGRTPIADQFDRPHSDRAEHCSTIGRSRSVRRRLAPRGAKPVGGGTSPGGLDEARVRATVV